MKELLFVLLATFPDGDVFRARGPVTLERCIHYKIMEEAAIKEALEYDPTLPTPKMECKVINAEGTI